MTRSSPRGPLAAFALGLLLAAGCGRPPAAVEGTVTYDGVPVDDGGITFVPAAGGAKAGAPVKNGRYAIDAAHGPAPGSYKVEVTWNKAVGRRVADPDTAGGTTRQVLPEKFNKATTLTADVTAGANRIDFDLKSR